MGNPNVTIIYVKRHVGIDINTPSSMKFTVFHETEVYDM